MITPSRRARVAHQLRREWPAMKAGMTPDGWLAYTAGLLVANRRGVADPERLRGALDDPEIVRVALQLIEAASASPTATTPKGGTR